MTISQLRRKHRKRLKPVVETLDQAINESLAQSEPHLLKEWYTYNQTYGVSITFKVRELVLLNGFIKEFNKRKRK